MFINYSSTSTTPTVTSLDTCAEWVMNPTGVTESLTGTSHTAASSPWSFSVPAGGIRGFVSQYAVTITNPNPAKLLVKQAGGKDPWPVPPPVPPALFTSCADYATRYAAFLLALGYELDDTKEEEDAPTLTIIETA
jgi:hypothetical protein